MNSPRPLLKAAAALALAFSAPVAQAALAIAYEWTEGGAGSGTNSTYVSAHGVRGPVLADDFVPSVSGSVVRIDWWGSAPLTAGAPDEWEATFHSSTGATPSTTYPTGKLSQHFVNSGGTDSDGDGVHFFTSAWNPQDMILVAGTAYWFSVANSACTNRTGTDPGPACLAGWTWANAGGAGPTVGSESQHAVNSYGVAADGGPHFGPWNTLFTADQGKQDLAFRIWVDVPEPSVLALLGIGLAGIAAARRRARQ